MASPAAQARAQALNVKLQGEAQSSFDTVERHLIRKIARESHTCALKCYDKAGTSGPTEALEACVRQCQAPHQQANSYVQSVRNWFMPGGGAPCRRSIALSIVYVAFSSFLTSPPHCLAGTFHFVLLLLSLVVFTLKEVNQYQNRLNRAMAECQDKARDWMLPGFENDAKKMTKVEEKLIECMTKTVDEYIALLQPLQERIQSNLKK